MIFIFLFLFSFQCFISQSILLQRHFFRRFLFFSSIFVFFSVFFSHFPMFYNEQFGQAITNGPDRWNEKPNAPNIMCARTLNSTENETQDERTRQKRIIVVDVPLIIPRRQCAFGTFDSVYFYIIRWCDDLISASLNMRARVLAIYLFHFDSVSRNWVFGNAANDKASFDRHNKNHVLFIVTSNSSRTRLKSKFWSKFLAHGFSFSALLIAVSVISSVVPCSSFYSFFYQFLLSFSVFNI